MLLLNIILAKTKRTKKVKVSTTIFLIEDGDSNEWPLF